MDNIFGTDGIRGVFGAELNCGSAYLLGAALCGADGDSPVVVVGRDTRPSGEELMRALAKGVHDNGGYVINIGILPTNAVAYLRGNGVRLRRYDFRKSQSARIQRLEGV